MHTCEQFLNMHVNFDIDVDFVRLFTFRILYFCVTLDHFIPVLLAFVVLSLVSSIPGQEIGWEERLRNDLFCIKWGVKP